MGATLAGGVHIVAATKDSQTDYWVAATPRDEGVAGGTATT
jgi:hypothetical protein